MSPTIWLFRADSGHVKALGLSSRVVAGLVPATPAIFALRLHIRGRRDKPGDDADWWFNAIEHHSR
jgi:hypothetical protein